MESRPRTAAKNQGSWSTEARTVFVGAWHSQCLEVSSTRRPAGAHVGTENTSQESPTSEPFDGDALELRQLMLLESQELLELLQLMLLELQELLELLQLM